jgi:hypothetical protein
VRFAHNFKSYVRVAPPLHPGVHFFCSAKRNGRKKTPPGATDTFLRFSGKSALA